MLKADPHTETGRIAEEPRLRAMAQQNEASVKSGVMLAGEGLQPTLKAHASSSPAERQRHRRSVRRSQGTGRGVLADPGELEEDALEWVKSYPFPFADAEVEVREAADVQV